MQNEWRQHPQLKDKFDPNRPDTLQVILHDGHPLDKRPFEPVWVTVTGVNGEVFRGRVTDEPQNLATARQGDEVLFVAAGCEHPIRVTEKYLAERPKWKISRCRSCGLSELFDAPSDLVSRVHVTLDPQSAKRQLVEYPKSVDYAIFQLQDCEWPKSQDRSPNDHGPMVEELGVRCPVCGKRVLRVRSKEAAISLGCILGIALLIVVVVCVLLLWRFW